MSYRIKLYLAPTLPLVLLFSLLLSYPTVAVTSEHAKRNVLIVHSSYETFPWTASIQKGIQESFSTSSQDVEFWIEYIDTKRNVDHLYFDQLRELFRIKYEEVSLDLIITTDNDAYNFVMKDRDRLFTSIPVVFTGFNNYQPELIENRPFVSGVVEENSFNETIDLALTLHPRTRTVVFVIPDAWPSRLAWVKDLPETYKSRVKIASVYSNSLDGIDSELKALGSDIVVIPLNSFIVSSGQYLPFPDLVSYLANKDYPVYGLWDIALGHGIVGGKLVNGHIQGREAGQLAIQILDGKAIQDLPVVEKSPNKYMFDWVQLERFNLSLNDLPDGAIVINRPITFYEQYKLITWVVTSAFLVMALLIVLLSFNIEKRRKVERKLSYQASHDSLTGLINRREFEVRAEALLHINRQHAAKHVLCYMDLDQFKLINDNYGHNAGDELLRQLGAELQKLIRRGDTLARLGGDEFGILMPHCSLENAHRITGSLLKMIQEYQFLWEGHSLKISVSIGLVPVAVGSASLTQLLKDADATCYMAKSKGRNRIQIYDSHDSELVQVYGEMQWVERIQYALEHKQFCLYAQPIIPLKGPTDEHCEVLLRMIDDSGEIISPEVFLPAAERYNLIADVDQWVVKTAFEIMANNPDYLEQLDFCSINLSGQSVGSTNTLDFIIKQLRLFKIPSHKICFEITETAAISNLIAATRFINKLKDNGCKFALDDFGSGLSSFAYLKNLPVDYLKIDGMFVKDIVDDPIDCAMVRSINEIGQVMGMKTIAEFVENDTIKDMVREIGVNFAQGYAIAKPMPLDEYIALKHK